MNDLHKLVTPILLAIVGFFAVMLVQQLQESAERLVKIEADLAVIHVQITGKVERFETVSADRAKRIESLEQRVTKLEQDSHTQPAYPHKYP